MGHFQSILREPAPLSLIIIVTNLGLKQGETTIYPVMKGNAVSVTGVHVKQLKTNHFLLVCPSYSSITDMCFTEIERKITLFPRRLSKETLLLHLMNSLILPTSN